MEPDGGELWNTRLKSRDSRKPLLVITHGTNMMKNGVLGNSSVIECRLQWIRKRVEAGRQTRAMVLKFRFHVGVSIGLRIGKKGEAKQEAGRLGGRWKSM